MQAVSRASTTRFRALVAGVAEVVKAVHPESRVALADRLQPTALLRLNLDTGELTAGDTTYNVIILDSDAACRLSTDDVGLLKSRLGPNGVIAIRHRPSWARPLARLFRRRADDVSQNAFLRGLPRSGAALLQARLYVQELRVRICATQKDSWVIGSPAPVGDTRYRDQIGRVATDYLRAVGPIIAAAHIPGI